jgi:NADH:ubiquinone oxidoreductase subunit 6 (subunit J)
MVRISTVLKILTFCIALLGYLPLSPFLETVPCFLFPAALVGGLLADRKGTWLRGSSPTIVSILFFLFYAAQISRENLVVPAVNLLTVLLSVRLISEKKVRNYLQILALSLFSLASSSLFSLDVLFLVYLIALLFLIAVALVILTFYAADNDMALSRDGVKTVLSVSLLMPAAALPLMCVFFVIMPRTQYPLWNFLDVSGSRVAGFSEKVQPGSAATVGAVRSPAFRVSCARLAKDQLYWRGVVLNTIVANAWVRGALPTGESGYITDSMMVTQTIYPEPGRSGYLFALNIPLRIGGVRANRTGDFVMKIATSAARRVKYEALSVPGNIIQTRGRIDREYYLQLPRALSPRMTAVARDVARQGETDEAKVELLKQFFLSRKISYATSDLPVSADPLDEFLFLKRRGNCEFFASSFAVLLRSAGVPARLVGGYYGGEYNDLGGYYLITEEMAHVWVEAYMAGKGWVMVDPSILSTNFQGVRGDGEAGLAFRLRMYLDSCNYYWNMAIINYDLEKQFQLVNRVNFQLKKISLSVYPGKVLLRAGGLLLLLILLSVATRIRRPSREERILRKFLRMVKRRYTFAILPSTGLHELAALVGDPLIDKFVAVYGRAVYHDRKLSGEEYRYLREILRALS